MTPNNRDEQRALVASAEKDTYEAAFAFLPTKVLTKTISGLSSGQNYYEWIWLRKYYFYKGKRLAQHYVWHLSLPDGYWFPGVERDPFVRV